MRTVEGRFATSRIYLWHCLAILLPGIDVPNFAKAATFSGDLADLDDAELTLLIEEGRRQMDRQASRLDSVRSRAGSFITIGLAELALFSGSAHSDLSRGGTLLAAWAVAFALATLGIMGALAIISAPAVFGTVDTRRIGESHPPLLPALALIYVKSTSIGEETLNTRLTVSWYALLLLVFSAVVYALAWPFAS